ncbi:DUF3280 domain-containing protein [Caenispirillum bisanense]|uniref:DUF3280 domain-containing protein n=1 Tax=Caenispirillum bisanense TaxID=414052 RepID=UPI0031E0DF08
MNRRLPAAAALALIAVLLLPAAAEGAAQQRRVLVLDVELLDTSGEGEAPQHPARLAAASRHLRDLLAEAGGLEVVTAAGETPRIRTCNGCELALARQAGADFVVTGLVRKVSTLILSITLTVRDAGSGAVVAEGVADIRGDTDRSWLRGIGWLVEHRLLAPPPPR